MRLEVKGNGEEDTVKPVCDMRICPSRAGDRTTRQWEIRLHSADSSIAHLEKTRIFEANVDIVIDYWINHSLFFSLFSLLPPPHPTLPLLVYVSLLLAFS